MTTFKESDDPTLTEKDLKYISKMMENIESLISWSREPMDSKVLGLLEMAYDMLSEQVYFDKHYTWDKAKVEPIEQVNARNTPKEKKFLFLNDSHTPPSAEELEEWFK